MNEDHKRKLKLKLRVLEQELRTREKTKNASLKGYNRTLKMIEELKRRLENG